MSSKLAKIVTIGSIKGGEGKSSTACQLAVKFCQERKNVLLIDADDQATSYDFTQYRDEQKELPQYTCMKLTGMSVREVALARQNGYDVIIIDVGGRDTESQRAAMSICDSFILPVPPASESLWTLDKLIKVAEEVKTINPSLKIYAFLNKADHQGSDNQHTIDYLNSIEELHYLDVVVKNRRAFRNAASSGLALNELKGKFKDPKAIKEFNQLYKEVKKHVIKTF